MEDLVPLRMSIALACAIYIYIYTYIYKVCVCARVHVSPVSTCVHVFPFCFYMFANVLAVRHWSIHGVIIMIMSMPHRPVPATQGPGLTFSCV